MPAPLTGAEVFLGRLVGLVLILIRSNDEKNVRSIYQMPEMPVCNLGMWF